MKMYVYLLLQIIIIIEAMHKFYSHVTMFPYKICYKRKSMLPFSKKLAGLPNQMNILKKFAKTRFL